MRLLVTTSRSLLLIDTESDESLPLDRGRGLYYGMTQAGDKLYVAARNRAVSSQSEQISERGEILIFDNTLQPCGSLQAPFPLRDLHEIGWHEGKLWATCSHDNMIAVYDGKTWEQWFPLGGSLEGPGDINHFNSFRFENDRIWILAHNRGDSELLAFSIETRALQESLKLGRCAHNIWQEQEQIFSCSSLEGRLMGNRGFMLETGGFPRGVAFGENFRCVGVSAMAEREARDFTTGKLMIFDGDWHLRKEIFLQDEGLILDIKIVPEGFRHCTATDTRLATPNSADAEQDLFYSAYENRNRGSRALIKSRLTVYRPFIDPLIGQYPAAKTIDLGCGRGEWLETMRETGFDACGVDLDPGMLAACRKQGLDARQADALQTLRGLPPESMVLVSAFHVVEHIPFDDVRTLVREALRVLKPGGLLILETPNPENLVVGASLFYQDPTHLRPVPPELLRFVVEFEGFERNIIARLQESPVLHTETPLNLLSVLEGVSPDYAVIGQKSAGPGLLAQFDQAFSTRYGLTLAAIAHRYEAQEQRRMANMAAQNDRQTADFHGWIAHAEARLSQTCDALNYLEQRDAGLEQRIAHVEARLAHVEKRAAEWGEQLAATLNSRSWRITAPIRWAGNQIILLRRHGVRTRLKALLKKTGLPLARTELPLDPIDAPHDGMPDEDMQRQCATTDNPLPTNTSSDTESLVAALTPRAGKLYRDLKNAVARNKESS